MLQKNKYILDDFSGEINLSLISLWRSGIIIEIIFGDFKEVQMKLELHFHTDESSPCGKIPAKEGIKQYKEAGYDGVAVSDHLANKFLENKEKTGSIL